MWFKIFLLLLLCLAAPPRIHAQTEADSEDFNRKERRERKVRRAGTRPAPTKPFVVTTWLQFSCCMGVRKHMNHSVVNIPSPTFCVLCG